MPGHSPTRHRLVKDRRYKFEFAICRRTRMGRGRWVAGVGLIQETPHGHGRTQVNRLLSSTKSRVHPFSWVLFLVGTVLALIYAVDQLTDEDLMGIMWHRLKSW
jgi:hypothetical protein